MTAAVGTLAQQLEQARDRSTAIADRSPFDSLDLSEAYAVQHAGIARAITAGHARAGVKLGFTSAEKMRQMGVDTPIIGTVLTNWQHVDGESVNVAPLIHPRIEPEVAFRLAHDVAPGSSPAHLISAIDAVAPALEIIDSRFDGFSFTLPSVVADNTSAARFAVGAWLPFAGGHGVGNLAVRLIVGDRVSAIGSTAAILGHPLRALGLLAVGATRHGFALRGGDVILAGAATAAAPLVDGVAAADVAGLGRVVLEIEGSRQ